MDYESHVGFVNTHSESNCGDDHIHFFEQERVLVFRAGDGIHAGVVRESADSVDSQQLGQFLHFLAGEAVDDAAFAAALLDEPYNVSVNIRGFRANLIV